MVFLDLAIAFIQLRIIINFFFTESNLVSTTTWDAITTKKTKISEGSLVRENVKSLSNSVTKFCNQGICEEFHFFRH